MKIEAVPITEPIRACSKPQYCTKCIVSVAISEYLHNKGISHEYVTTVKSITLSYCVEAFDPRNKSVCARWSTAKRLTQAINHYDKTGDFPYDNLLRVGSYLGLPEDFTVHITDIKCVEGAQQ